LGKLAAKSGERDDYKSIGIMARWLEGGRLPVRRDRHQADRGTSHAGYMRLILDYSLLNLKGSSAGLKVTDPNN
jgi:hypothetical protein